MHLLYCEGMHCIPTVLRVYNVHTALRVYNILCKGIQCVPTVLCKDIQCVPTVLLGYTMYLLH